MGITSNLLTDEQKRILNEKRTRALEKLRRGKTAGTTANVTGSSRPRLGLDNSDQRDSKRARTNSPSSNNTNGPRGTSDVSGTSKTPSRSSAVPPAAPAPHIDPLSREGIIKTGTDVRLNRNSSDAHFPAVAPKRANDKYLNYIEYDFDKMKDTRGGFVVDEEQMKENEITLEEWQKDVELEKAPISIDPTQNPKCFECGTVDIDYRLYVVFGCRVCRSCRNKLPEKYSLLTKTECREDYLLTDPELNDKDLLPHLEKPNPHKTSYNNMMLYLRYQVEEYAFKKWGGPEGLDAEYEKRVELRKKRKDRKFLQRLTEMRKKTRAAEINRRKRKNTETHEHEWGNETRGEDGAIKRTCITCGFETEEFVLG